MKVIEEKMPSGRRNGVTRTMMSRTIEIIVETEARGVHGPRCPYSLPTEHGDILVQQCLVLKSFGTITWDNSKFQNFTIATDKTSGEFIQSIDRYPATLCPAGLIDDHGVWQEEGGDFLVLVHNRDNRGACDHPPVNRWVLRDQGEYVEERGSRRGRRAPERLGREKLGVVRAPLSPRRLQRPHTFLKDLTAG
jgi:hypothetical protein